jgi:hypothetical protein
MHGDVEGGVGNGKRGTVDACAAEKMSMLRVSKNKTTSRKGRSQMYNAQNLYINCGNNRCKETLSSLYIRL